MAGWGDSVACLGDSVTILGTSRHSGRPYRILPVLGAAVCQGLTLVHFSAQHKRILWDRGVLRGG